MEEEEVAGTECEIKDPVFNIDSLIVDEPSLHDILTRTTRNAWRPDISDLPDAVVDDKFIVPVGGKLLIEYTDQPSRDTTCWIVERVFPEAIQGYTVEAGHVALYDRSKMHYGCTNYLDAASQGLLLKVADKKRKWTPGEEETLMERKGKRRRRFVNEEQLEESRPRIEGEPVKKKLGRPKGSRNKSTIIHEIAQAKIVTTRVA